MAVPNTQTEPPASAQTPLIILDSNQQELNDTQLNHSLHRLETFIRIFGFCQYSALSATLSWLVFLLLGVALPLSIIELSYCSDCEKYQIKNFELEILISESLVAAISLLFISHNLRKYGVRKFLFVDRHHGHMTQFREEYIQKINHQYLGRYHFLMYSSYTTAVNYKIDNSLSSGFLPLVGSVAITMLPFKDCSRCHSYGSALFNLVCNLQIIHFENYGKLLERDLDVSVYIEEHIRLKHNLSKISHRFRIYLVLELLVVTASQFVALLETTGNPDIINFINGGDFAVSSIVELVGLIICLHSAAKISYRSLSLAAISSRWHALVTCNPNDVSQRGISSNGGNLEAAFPAVMYMQSNLGGATIYGWTIDRPLINTVFFLEFSLVLFVLGKTITFTTK
nr:hypothetical protein CFP56_67140 [Quercus suber]